MIENPESLAKYIDVTKGIPHSLEETLNVDNKKAVGMLKKSHRVFFSGSGSSLPAALFGAYYMGVNSDTPAILANPYLILENKFLKQDDLVVLVSQGWSRADATVVTDRIRQNSPASLLVYTGSPEKNPDPSSEQIHSQEIFPKKEKLFCRPGSVFTAYASVADLVLQATTGEKLDKEKALQAWENGQNYPVEELPYKHIVVLSSGLALSGAHNAQLSLREGAGKHAELHTIEDYGHGQYVTDQMRIKDDPNSTGYLLIAHQQDPYSMQSLERISPLIEGTHSPHITWITQFDAMYGNLEIFSRISSLVASLNTKSHFDMNEPPGKEENRSFHEK